MDFKRGDIVTVNLNPKKGHEIEKKSYSTPYQVKKNFMQNLDLKR